ncbi:hypothetical protein ACIQ4I_00230 [Rummeliibacillus sp. NPDC094406]|uniref:hypothetical protein n=1 Tax=Rummeliibacillus sp. NPDC094406 TaxID=3364511 RepID=UPI00381BBB2B
MGVMCPCGVKVKAKKKCHNVKFKGVKGTIKGNLTYRADICVTKLASSTLCLEFKDKETPNKFSFLFKAISITSVKCKKEGQNCVISVKGTGMIGKKVYLFKAIFIDQIAQDKVKCFVIKNFFDQNGSVSVPQGSIVALGCQTL